MTHVIIKHKVHDYAAWKAEFDNFADTRRSFGEKSYHIFHPGDDPNNLTLLFGWNGLQRAEAFFSSPELKAAMQRAGVAEEPRVQFLNEVAQGTL